MAVTSANASTENVTRRAAAAHRRKGAFLARLATAATERNTLHALVWWWLSEVRRLPVERRQVEFGRLRALCDELNKESAR